MSFRILDQSPVYFGNDGLPLAGGEVRFYLAGTTTPKDVYGDPALTINNGPVITLNASGRSDVEIWGDGSYKVRLYNAALELQAEADDVEAQGGSGQVIPALVTGKFLTNDGAQLLWATIRQVPDPTGQNGKVLGTDGSALIWQTLPEPEEPEIVLGSGSFRAGTSASTTKFFLQYGSDTAPATGAVTSTMPVTFATPFAVAPKVFVFPQNTNIAPAVANMQGLPSTTGFTVIMDLAEGNAGNANIVTPIPFDWVAVGTVVVP